MDAVWSQGALLFGQEGHPERHAIDRHAKRELRLMISPDRNRRALQRTVDAVVIASGDLVTNPALHSRSVSRAALSDL